MLQEEVSKILHAYIDQIFSAKNKIVLNSLITYFFTLALILISGNLEAQNGTLSGFILDAETGEAMIGATIVLKGTGQGAISEYDGSFSLTDLNPGEQVFQISYLGYASKEENILIISGENVTRNIEMAYEIIEGEVITISAQADAQNAAINRQLSSRSIVNVVSAKKIQELPDANAA